MVITGELSGDFHAAGLLGEFKKLHSNVEIIGTGGSNLKKIGAKLLFSIDDMAIFGLGEIFKKYRLLKHIMRTLIGELENSPPDLIIAVDYSGFNLRFIPHAKERGIPVIYYVSPQVWITRSYRVQAIKKYADALISILPFEVEFYRKFGMDIHYFGHPLADNVRKTLNRQETAAKHQLDADKSWVVYLLGSRKSEIGKNLSVIEAASEQIKAKYPNTEFISCISSNFEQFQFDTEKLKRHIRFIPDDMYNILGNAQFAAVCSGTAALESALLGTPMVIYYKPDLPAFLASYYIFGVRTVGLPNIIAGKQIVEEFIEYNLPDKHGQKTIADYVADRAMKQLEHPETAESYREEAKKLQSVLNVGGAYKKAAQFISEFLKQHLSHKE